MPFLPFVLPNGELMRPSTSPPRVPLVKAEEGTWEGHRCGRKGVQFTREGEEKWEPSPPCHMPYSFHLWASFTWWPPGALPSPLFSTFTNLTREARLMKFLLATPVSHDIILCWPRTICAAWTSLVNWATFQNRHSRRAQNRWLLCTSAQFDDHLQNKTPQEPRPSFVYLPPMYMEYALRPPAPEVPRGPCKRAEAWAQP